MDSRPLLYGAWSDCRQGPPCSPTYLLCDAKVSWEGEVLAEKGTGSPMHERTRIAGATTAPGIPGHQPTVERERAVTFSRILRILLQRHGYYIPLTSTYLLPQFYDRLLEVDGRGINVNTLGGYLRSTIFPSERKVRLMADALGVSRGMLLFASGYLTPQDLPDYPGPMSTLAAIQTDIAEVERLPLSPQARRHIVFSLRNTARMLRLLHADRMESDWHVEANERELLVEQMIDLLESPNPAPVDLTIAEESGAVRNGSPETAGLQAQ
jgi:hypothetical protein